jgi:hypothetical protein
MTYSRAWRARGLYEYLLDTRSRFRRLDIARSCHLLTAEYLLRRIPTALTHHGVEIIRQIISYYAVLYLGIGQRLSLVIYQ